MSQSLILFEASGKLVYQFNNKATQFNDLISHLVNNTAVELEPDFFTQSTNLKRYYILKRGKTYASIFFDTITTLDSDKIRNTLDDVLITYSKLSEEDSTDDSNEKLKKMVDLQFAQLMKFKSNSFIVKDIGSSVDKSSHDIQGQTLTTEKKGAKKKMRRWDDGESVDRKNSDSLDYSDSKTQKNLTSSEEQRSHLADDSAFVQTNDVVLMNELNDILGHRQSNDEINKQHSISKGFFGKLSSYFDGSVDVKELFNKFREQLISKNIAPPTAGSILSRVNHQLGDERKVPLVVYKQAIIEELTKILTPNVSTDLLYEMKRVKGSRPYVISVVGVNGVGKSTNLAKMAYWFLQNNLDVLICASDTFRSGAVEQLKTHVNNLKRLNSSSTESSRIEIFEKGYGGGDHVIATAKLAIKWAASENYDVVLIDTAGRTHSNAKLMAPLKKFGDAANPDKIIMVGEALVGTDSVEQAINFNNAFGNKRGLDFFIISKVDTVGDMMGSMINMVVATKVPVLFVGTGQTYTDIKRLNVNKVVDLLLT